MILSIRCYDLYKESVQITKNLAQEGKEGNKQMKKEKTTIVIAGILIGVISAMLVFFGNPANMGFCIACFLRDTTGALGLHSAAAVQYIRPEIIGLVLGACIVSLITKEFRPRGGSAPITRFTLGAFAMIGCLMFLGCPFRMILRLAGGDGNAIFGLVGFVCGILTGTFFLKKGYTLKRSYKMPKLEGAVYPAFQIVMLILLVAAPAFIHFTEPEGGPGAKHAAILISLAAGVIVGIVAQRTRLCMVGGIRDAVLFGEYKLLFGFVAILISALLPVPDSPDAAQNGKHFLLQRHYRQVLHMQPLLMPSHFLSELSVPGRKDLLHLLFSYSFSFQASAFLVEFTTAITATTTIPITTAILPFAVGPSAEDARPKLCEKAAPAINPRTATTESVFPSPERISWRIGQPPRINSK